ncbi:MAG: thioredoxin family protein [Phycisphaeraceae bacterium]|nr:thioredoxin family protein [Phycisphaeraceae bacterium]
MLADVGAERTEAFDKLINDAALAGVANDHFVVVHVQRSGEKATPQADVDRAVKLLDDLEAEKGDGRLAVVDVSGRQPRLRWSASKVPEAADMRITLIKQMPRVPYRGGWIENYSQAQIIAAQTGRPIMLYFTGSDWCPPCQAFDRNILSTREFMAYARENLVLVKLDFPRNAPQSEEQKRHNQQVQRQYEVRGFPTMIFMDPKGKELDKTVGFPGGTPAAFVERLKKAAEG